MHEKIMREDSKEEGRPDTELMEMGMKNVALARVIEDLVESNKIKFEGRILKVYELYKKANDLYFKIRIMEERAKELPINEREKLHLSIKKVIEEYKGVMKELKRNLDYLNYKLEKELKEMNKSVINYSKENVYLLKFLEREDKKR